jgi:cardiolipin synthase A/B
MQPTSVALTALATLLSLLAAGHALLYKRRPQAALGWIAVSLTLPFAGPLLYYLFGINRVEARARSLRGAEFGKAWAPPEKEFPWALGNRVVALHNGESAYPLMLEAIRDAKEFVYLSTYIFSTTDVGGDFVEVLGDAAGRGVDVHVLLDGIGELYTWPLAGGALGKRRVKVARFLPPRLIPPALRINLRNHRKLLIVDGAVAFTGGMNIAARHLAEDASRPRRVVDLHFKLEGSIVSQLAGVFAADWHFATRETLIVRERAAAAAGAASCRAVPDGPDDNRDPLTALLLRSIASARHRVAIMTPYFLPSPELVGVLQASALRGIDVSVVLPAENNLPYVHWATRHMLWQLLLFGVRIYYQPPPFVHTKLLVIDDESVVVGSWNIDPRSLRLNFELAVEIREPGLIGALAAHFDAARAASAPVTLRDVDGRSVLARLRDGAAWLMSPYL